MHVMSGFHLSWVAVMVHRPHGTNGYKVPAAFEAEVTWNPNWVSKFTGSPRINPIARDCAVMSLEGVARYLSDRSAMPRRLFPPSLRRRQGGWLECDRHSFKAGSTFTI